MTKIIQNDCKTEMDIINFIKANDNIIVNVLSYKHTISVKFIDHDEVDPRYNIYFINQDNVFKSIKRNKDISNTIQTYHKDRIISHMSIKDNIFFLIEYIGDGEERCYKVSIK